MVSDIYFLLCVRYVAVWLKPEVCNTSRIYPARLWVFRTYFDFVVFDFKYVFVIRTSKILMRLNVFIFSRISTSKCSYFVFIFCETFWPVNMTKISPNVNTSHSNWGIEGIEYFNAISEEYEVIYHDGTSNYIAKDDFEWVLVILM